MANKKYDDLYEEAAKALERARNRDAQKESEEAAGQGAEAPVAQTQEIPKEAQEESKELLHDPAPQNEKAVETYNQQESIVKSRKTGKKLTPLNMALITAICLVLTVGIYLIISMTIGDGLARDDEKGLDPLTDHLSNEVEYMTITTEEGVVTLKRNEDDDYIVAELDERLELSSDSVASVLAAAAHLVPESIVNENCSDWATYGLDKPAGTVFIQFDDGDSATIEVGDFLAVGSGGYCRFNGGNTLYTIADYQVKYFSYDLYDFANATIPDINFAAIESCLIELENQEPIRILVDRNKAGDAAASYTMQEPYNMSADASEVVMFCQSMKSIYINEVIGYKEDLVPYGLDTPRSHVYYKDLNGIEYELFVGDVSKDDDTMTYIAIKDKHCVLACKTGNLSFLDTDLVNFMDAYVNLIYIGQVNAMKVTDGTTTYNVRLDNKPKYDAKGKVITLANGSIAYDQTIYVNGKKVQTEAFRKVYANIIGIALSARIEDDSFNIKEHTPDLTVQFTLNTEPSSLKVDYYKLTLNEYAISRDGSDAVMVANSEHVESIMEAFAQLMNGQLDVEE